MTQSLSSLAEESSPGTPHRTRQRMAYFNPSLDFTSFRAVSKFSKKQVPLQLFPVLTSSASSCVEHASQRNPSCSRRSNSSTGRRREAARPMSSIAAANSLWENLHLSPRLQPDFKNLHGRFIRALKSFSTAFTFSLLSISEVTAEMPSSPPKRSRRSLLNSTNCSHKLESSSRRTL